MLSKEEVKKIAKLARLELSEKEIEKMRKDLSAVLDYFNSLKKVKSKAVNVDSSDNLSEGTMRIDESKPQSAEVVERLIEAAPDKKGKYIKVKAIL
jgi:aspartyl-tRNA(Asn)/glutamyl-tRNA(Gln) amidotransferase subunit C